MPKAPKVQTTPVSSHSSVLVYIYNNQRVAGRRGDNFVDSVKTCRALFPRIPITHQISFHTRDLDFCEGQLTKLSPDVWKESISTLKSVTVTSEPLSPQDPASDEPPAKFKLKFHNPLDGGFALAIVRPTTRFAAIFSAVSKEFGLCAEEMKFYHKGIRIQQDETPDDFLLVEGDIITAQVEQVGGKPVIYVFSPTPIEASVKLSLVPEWEFSAIYPVVQRGKPLASQREVEWRVRTHENGDLSELNTGLEVSYLFWEAHTLPKLLDSPPPSPVLQADANTVKLTETFVPNAAVVYNENAVLLSVDAITPYLDAALKVLGLHTEARTSFITYWLPSFLKHKHVALRFLPQAAYEKAAPLDVTPTPDVVTRIFMLFKGVDEDELELWHTAKAKAVQAASFWKDVVDVDVDRTLNKQLFRVIEWGGMEVLY